jgi:acyl-CoA thioesterase FadM
MSEAYYVLIFGDATDAFYDHIGLGPAQREADQISVYTVEAHIRYLTEAHAGAALRIATRVLCHDAKRLRLRHDMLHAENGRLLAITELLLLHVDKRTLRASSFAQPIYQRIEHIAQAHAALPQGEPVVSRHWHKG